MVKKKKRSTPFQLHNSNILWPFFHSVLLCQIPYIFQKIPSYLSSKACLQQIINIANIARQCQEQICLVLPKTKTKTKNAGGGRENRIFNESKRVGRSILMAKNNSRLVHLSITKLSCAHQLSTGGSRVSITLKQNFCHQEDKVRREEKD